MIRFIAILFLVMSPLALGCSDTDPSNCHLTKKMEISPRTRRLAAQFEADVKSGRLTQRVDRGLDALIRLAVWKLKVSGHKAEANTLLKEWKEEHWRLTARDLGDHAPLSQWLADKYAQLELILGTQVLEALRLDAIKNFNYGIPVTLWCEDDVVLLDYQQHAEPLMTSAAYWTTYIVCVGGTWGTGFMFCSPIAMGTEWLTENVVAPKLSEPLWKLVCKPGDDECLAGY